MAKLNPVRLAMIGVLMIACCGAIGNISKVNEDLMIIAGAFLASGLTCLAIACAHDGEL